MGNIDLKFHLSNIDLNPDMIAGLLFSFPQILIHDAAISYNDNSLVQRLIKEAAKENGKEYDSFISDIVKEIDNEIFKEEDKFTKKGLEAIKKFVKDPNKISVSISPEKPIPIGRLQRIDEPKEIIKLLNAKFSI